MAFLDMQFPADIAYGSAGGPSYSTDVIITQSGWEQRNSNWAASRARYNVAQGVRTQAQLEALIAFFRVCKGRAHGFRFKDWTDFAVVGQAIGTGNGAQTQFQLVRTYTSGAAAESRAIAKPVTGSVKIYKAGVLQTSSVAVNYATGLVTFTAAPASGAALTADFEFDVPARFDTDRLATTIEDYGIHSVLDIPIVEIRV